MRKYFSLNHAQTGPLGGILVNGRLTASYPLLARIQCFSLALEFGPRFQIPLSAVKAVDKRGMIERIGIEPLKLVPGLLMGLVAPVDMKRALEATTIVSLVPVEIPSCSIIIFFLRVAQTDPPQVARLQMPRLFPTVSESGCHSCRQRPTHKNRTIPLNAAFCRLVFLQPPSHQADVAEACGSRM